MTPQARPAVLALAGLAVAEVMCGSALAAAVGWGWSTVLDTYVATNGLMGLSFAVCGAVITWHRPRLVVGWLFVLDGLGHATSALAAPLVRALRDGGAPPGAQRLAATVFAYSWPWSIALFLPLVLLLFPSGRLPSPRWRPVAVAVVVTAPLFVVESGASSDHLKGGVARGYLTLSGYHDLDALWAVSEARTLAALVLGVVALVVRYRRGVEAERRQLLWLLIAGLAVVVVTAAWAFVGGTPTPVLFAFPLIPIAVTVAIVRYQLLDIRLVMSRAVAWLALSVLALAAYVAIVTVLDQLVSARLGRSALATVAVALLAAPLLPRLQRRVDRALYGDRRDPARVASRIGLRLAEASAGLNGVAAAVRDGLRLPYVGVRTGDELVAEDGVPPARVEPVPLTYAGRVVGELLIGLRPGERDLAEADAAVLPLVAAPLAVAVHALRLTEDLQRSRERLVTAREEERRRLRRDLHDGLGPTLTGMALAADAAGNLAATDTDRTLELLAGLRTDARAALTDVRRILEDLRPPALDQLGLVEAVQQRADHLAGRAGAQRVRIRLDAPERLPRLPAAIEVAAYRITTEALTNVIRHSGASNVVVQICCDDTLIVEVLDDGPVTAAWCAGVGLQAMRERALELGGTFHAGPEASGGRVYAALPLAAVSELASEPMSTAARTRPTKEAV